MTTITTNLAERYLRATSMNNRTSLIGSPDSGRYTLKEATDLLLRAETVVRSSTWGFPTLVISLPDGLGVHTWYLNFDAPRSNPWA